VRRFILPPDYRGAETCLVSGKNSHYLSRVLRLKPGDSFEAEDSSGRGYQARVLECSNGFLLGLSPLEPSVLESESISTELTLFQCLPKGAKLDLIVRQATEAGVARIVPVLSENAVPRVSVSDWEPKRERLERVIREARQQSGSLLKTEILEPIDLKAAVDLWADSQSDCSAYPGFFFHEKPLAETSLHRYLNEVPARVALMVGPEGGLSPVETELLRDRGWHSIFLGRNVLRAETAAIYAIAAAQIILLERKTWAQTPNFPHSESTS
jgi:16S rRNA (uracil1498-N3)-methyltransferase